MATDQENVPAVAVPSGQPAVDQDKSQPDRTPQPQRKSDAQVFEDLIRRYSRPASLITGRIVSLFGLALVVATLVLGLIHMLVAVDFSTAIIAGAALSIAGIWTIKAEDDETRRAAEREFVRQQAANVSDSIERHYGSQTR